jgi:hypothetical protein
VKGEAGYSGIISRIPASASAPLAPVLPARAAVRLGFNSQTRGLTACYYDVLVTLDGTAQTIEIQVVLN